MASTDLSITVKLIASPNIEAVKSLITDVVSFWHFLPDEAALDMVQMLSNEDVIFSLVEYALWNMSERELKEMIQQWQESR